MLSGILNAEELLAIRFYMGDPEVAEKGPYEGGTEAYNTINALMHPGSANEQDKAKEGRVIMLTGADQLKNYLTLILHIYSAMEKYRQYCIEKNSGPSVMSFRLDRLSSLQRFEADHHRVAGFFSTCKRGFLPEYAHKKADVVMLEVERDSPVPFLDFEDIFEGCYAKPEEAEILLPFGMIIDRMVSLNLSEQERKLYRDINGQPPAGKWRLHMTMEPWPEVREEKLQKLYQAVTEEKTVGRVMNCMDLLTAGEVLTDDEEDFYGIWKKQLQQYIMGTLGHQR
ncbi:MAG: hypothetical protein ACI4BB_03435 [Coprococcus sp.]